MKTELSFLTFLNIKKKITRNVRKKKNKNELFLTFFIRIRLPIKKQNMPVLIKKIDTILDRPLRVSIFIRIIESLSVFVGC